MKGFLAFLFGVGCNALHLTQDTTHDDTLRANQGDRAPSFSYWRALVS
jgi:hypothetical protein